MCTSVLPATTYHCTNSWHHTPINTVIYCNCNCNLTYLPDKNLEPVSWTSSVSNLKNSAADSRRAGVLFSIGSHPGPCWSSNVWILKSAGRTPKSFIVSWFAIKCSSEREDKGRSCSLSNTKRSNDLIRIDHVDAPDIWFPVRTRFVRRYGGFLVFSPFLSAPVPVSLPSSWSLPFACESFPFPLPLPFPRPRPAALPLGWGSMGGGGMFFSPHGQEIGKSLFADVESNWFTDWLENSLNWTGSRL